jgi:hypothetical protein
VAGLHCRPIFTQSFRPRVSFSAQVVSTRGEKFTFVKTEADVEMEKRMEKTYVQLGTLYTKGKRGA